jgi:DNA-binding MarR family transcriptional regulator
MTDVPETSHAITESLKSLGLTKYEALVYIALLSVEGATATEIHEISGVPRASVYPVLDRLIQKNLVSVSHATPKRFNAAPPEEGINILLTHINRDAARAQEALEEIYRSREGSDRGCQELIWSIYGEENIRNRLMEMISRATSELKVISNWHFLKGELLDQIRQSGHTAAVEIIADRWEGEPLPYATILGGLPGGHEKFGSQDMAGIFIVDRSRVLVMMGSVEATPTALYSESQGFIQFFMRYWTFVRSMIGRDGRAQR